jgi:5-methyltetrahydropteroyltriglutamate--homocysteine methyltransferase
VQDALIEELIGEQVAAGVDLVTDGHVRWSDAQTPLAAGLEGFTNSHDDLIRYFDNNTYYRRPHVTGPVRWREPITVAGWRFASSVAERPVKQTLTGPYSLVRLSHNEFYEDEADLVLDVARALNAEARALESAGATYVQFDEPAIVAHPSAAQGPQDFGLAFAAAAAATEGLGLTTEIRTFFGGVEQPAADFFALPFDVFGLDFVDGASNWDLVAGLPLDRRLSAGLLDGRATALEPLDALDDQIRRLAELIGRDRLEVTPSCGLEYLPRERAQRKLRRLTEAVRAASAAEGVQGGVRW